MDAPAEDLVLHHEEHGAGEPVLLVHGFGASTYSWRFVVPALAATHRVLLVDLNGFGDSPKPADDGYSIYDQVKLLTAFIRRHDLAGLTLGGHSFGGGVALLAALELMRDPRYRPRRLVLVDNVAYPQRLPLFIRALRSPGVGAAGVAALPNRMQVRCVLKLAYHDDDKVPEDAVREYAKALYRPGGKRALVLTARHMIPPDIEQVSARYRELDVPTLILWGREDAIVPLAVGERLHASIRGSRFVAFDRCGHIPHEECPDAATREILAFVRAA